MLERSLEDLSKILLNDSFKAVDLQRVSVIPIVGIGSYIGATASKNEREATNDRCEGCHDDTSKTSELSIDSGTSLLLWNSLKEGLRIISLAQDESSHVPNIVSAPSNEDTFDHDAHGFSLLDDCDLQ